MKKINVRNHRDPSRLHIFAISDREKQLAREVLKEAIRVGMTTQAALWKKLGLNPRYILEEPKERRRRGETTPSKKVDVQYEKWVSIYNYIMGDLYDDALRLERTAVTQRVRMLEAEGLKSDRYANDLHVFNRTFLNQNTYTSSIDPRLLNKSYLVLRYSSNQQKLLTGMLQFSQDEGTRRYVFRSKVWHEGKDREVKGTVYQLNSHLTLLGFLKGGGGIESYTINPVDDSLDVLYGIMTTTGVEQQPHSKQCCFIKAESVDGIYISKSVFVEPDAWDKQKLELDDHFKKDILGCVVPLVAGEPVDWRRYITDRVLQFRKSADYERETAAERKEKEEKQNNSTQH